MRSGAVAVSSAAADISEDVRHEEDLNHVMRVKTVIFSVNPMIADQADS
jgi:hypothetical protein